MYYDPVKEMLGSLFSGNIRLRRLFYRLLDAVILRTWHMHREIRIWAKEHPQATHILDAGTGYGQFAYYLHKLNPHYSVLGIDLKTDQISRANHFCRERKIPNLYFQTADLNTFVRPGAFDLVLCNQVMEYIEDDELVFRNLFNSLRENGIFLMSCPSDCETFYRMSQFRFPDETEFIREGYNLSALKARLRKLGYRKVRARYTYGKPGQISWLISIKWPVSTLRASRYFLVLMPVYFLLIFPLCLLLNLLDTKMGHLSGAGIILKAYK